MNYFSIDHLIVYAFLLLTLLIGLRAGKGIKDIREYAIANRMFGTGALVMTLLATNIGGASTLDTASDVFSDGIIMIAALSGVPMQLIIIATFITPYMKHFKKYITIGDVMGSFYGAYSQVITGVLGVLYSFCMIGMELFMTGIVCESLLGIKAAWGIPIGGLLLAAYSTLGGIKAVTATDVFQFLILFIVIPLIASIVINQVGGIEEVFNQVSSEKFKVFSHEKFSFHLTLFLLWSIFPVGLISPPIFQRLLMAKDGRQLRKQYFIVAAFDPLLQLTVMMIGLAGLVLYPKIDAANVMPHIIQELLPIGLKGLAIAGMLAVIMSTADSYLHTAGLLLSHDVIKPLSSKKKIAINELSWTRYSTFFIGAITIVIGLKATNVISLSFGAMKIAGPLLLFPLIAGIIGLKPDKWIFYAAMLITLGAFTIASFFLPKGQSHLAVLISITINGISFLSIHAIRNRGIVIIDRVKDMKLGTLWKPRCKSIAEQARTYFPTLPKIIKYSQQRVEQYGAPYVLFGVFCCINFTFPYFMWTHELPQAYNLMIVLRLLGAIACGFLIVKEKWYRPLKPYLPTFWHLTILYCLPFMSTIMFLLTQGSVEWLINIIATIMFLIMLVDWLSVGILTILGVALGFLFYTQVIGTIQINLDFSSYYLLVYQVVFGTFIGLLFARRKQQNFDLLEGQKQLLATTHTASEQDRLHTLQYQNYLKTAIEGPTEPLATTKKAIRTLAKTAVEKETAQKAIDQIEGFVMHYKNTFYQTMDFLRLQVREIRLEDLLDKLYRSLKKEGVQEKVSFQIQTQQKNLTCDPDKMIQLLATSLRTLQKQAPQGRSIHLQVQDTQLAYQFKAVPNQTRTLAALAFTLTTDNKVATPKAYYQGNTNEPAINIPENLSQLPQRENARIIDAHYGYSESTDSLILHVIPVKLRNIRPKVVDELPAATQNVPLDNEASIKQEKALLTALKSNTTVDIELVKEVINYIKKVHQGQTRKSGDLFYTHPMTVARLLLDLTQDQAALIAALLHDAVEDTPVGLEQITYQYGKEVAFIVDKVTHLDQTLKKAKLTEVENQLQLAAHQDPRIVMVKLADRLHNVRTLHFHEKKERQKEIVQETLTFYVPLGRMLGLPAVDKVVQEIEEQCQTFL